MIEVKGLTKMYGDRVAIEDISFRVEKGEILGFLGQNGAGKSTTMKILTCYMSPTSGTATVAGFDTFEHPLEVKRRIGYLPEIPPLYGELLISEYLTFVAELKGLKRAQKTQAINKVIEQCNLGDVRKRLIGNLSKGFRQRVGVAQALLNDPEVLIMDEPTIGLDPKQVTEIRALIQSMKADRTVIYSTHILSEVAATCNRIVIIDQGKLVAQESLDELDANGLGRTELVVQQSSPALIKSLQALGGVRDVKTYSNGANRIVVESEPRPELAAEMAKTVVAHEGGLLRMAPVKLALEQHYLDLIGATRS